MNEMKYAHREEIDALKISSEAFLSHTPGTWGLTMKEAHLIDVVQRKQLRVTVNEPRSQSIKIKKMKAFFTCSPTSQRDICKNSDGLLLSSSEWTSPIFLKCTPRHSYFSIPNIGVSRLIN